MHRASGGVPRLVNIIAHKCLMLVFGQGGHRVRWRHVLAAVRDTPSARRGGFPWFVTTIVAVGMTGVLMLLVA